jgi:ppGpp synthetase/RelA/SpoT-type nucleotidyltranferase
MTNDSPTLTDSYDAIEPHLKSMAASLLDNLSQLLEGVEHIDKIALRVKARQSFLDKANKTVGDKPQYKKPFQEIQDILGARIVLLYKSDMKSVSKIIEKAFNPVEKQQLIPEEENEFGYEGLHYVLFVPPHIAGHYRGIPNIPTFFELQIKTLYQHAWAQAEHGLGYKPGVQLDRDTKRKLAFVAAQSWGADEMLETLYKQILTGKLNN